MSIAKAREARQTARSSHGIDKMSIELNVLSPFSQDVPEVLR